MSRVDEIGIGGRLRSARRRLGWSREALAFHSGISWSAIAQVEIGRRQNLRPTTLQALAAALGVTIDYLVTGRGLLDPMFQHRALIYRDDTEFLAATMPFLSDAVDAGEAALAVTSPAKIVLLRERLGARATGVEFAEHEDWYSTPVAALARYRGYLSARLEAGSPWVWMVGEPVWTGRSSAEIKAWARYESLVNIEFKGNPATILCPYDASVLSHKIIAAARATHPATPGADVSSFADPSAFVLGS